MELNRLAKLLMSLGGRQGPLCLLYHSIEAADALPTWRWAVSLRSFCAQLDLLSELGYHTVPASALKDPGRLPQKTVCLTFDDGYEDNLLGVEALAARGMCASFFMVAGDIGRHAGWLGPKHPKRAMLTAQQLCDMESAGMEVCSHTMRHPRLTEQPDDIVKAELLDSRAVLSELLGRSVDVFAYPHGAHDAHIVELTREAGYALAFTTVDRFMLPTDDLLRIPRVNIMSTDSISWFARKITFGTEQVSWRDVLPKVPRLARRQSPYRP